MSVPSSSDEKESVVEPHKDEFDVSDSDDGGLAKKVLSKQKKPAIAKKVVTTSKRKKDSTTDDASKTTALKAKVAPKKMKKAIVESDSGSDFNDAPPAREKPAGKLFVVKLI